jgi:flagellar export protein FliJ
MEELQKEIDEANQIFDKKQTELKQIAQKRKALEKIREKKLAEFNVDKIRNEQKSMDENYQILRQFKE